MSEHLLPSSQVYAPTSAEQPFMMLPLLRQAASCRLHPSSQAVQMQAHYMVRLLTQHGCELPGSDPFQTASDIQNRAAAMMPHGPTAHAATSHSMHRASTKQEELAAMLPSYLRSQDKPDMF